MVLRVAMQTLSPRGGVWVGGLRVDCWRQQQSLGLNNTVSETEWPVHTRYEVLTTISVPSCATVFVLSLPLSAGG